MQLIPAAVGLILIMIVMLVRPQTAMVIAFFLVMASSTSISALGPFSVEVRVLAVMVVLTLSFRQARQDEPRDYLGPRAAHSLTAFLLSIGSMLAFISIAHAEAGLGDAALGVASCLIFVVLPLRLLTAAQLIRSLRAALFITLAASLIMAAVVPSIAFRGGRLQGLTGNANLIGFYVFLYVGLVVCTEVNWRALVGPLTLGATVLVMSSSRVSGIATIVLLLGSAALRVGAMRKTIPWLSVAIGAATLLWQDTLTSDLGLLRTGNSRAQSWTQMQEALQVSPLTGVGIEGITVEVASSPLRALAAGGIVAGALFVVALCSLLMATRSRGAARVLVLAAIVHSLAEGWLVSLTGPIVLLFVVALSALLAGSRSSDCAIPTAAATTTGFSKSSSKKGIG